MDHSTILLVSAILLSFLAFITFWEQLPEQNRMTNFCALLFLLSISFAAGSIFSTLPVNSEIPPDRNPKVSYATETYDLFRGDYITVNLAGKTAAFQQTGRYNSIKVKSTGGELLKIISVEVMDVSQLQLLTDVDEQEKKWQYKASSDYSN